MDEAEKSYYAKEREGRQRRKAQRLSDFDSSGWTRHTEYHFSRSINGERIDYWPTTRKWMFRGRVSTGNVKKFINKLLTENAEAQKSNAGRWSRSGSVGMGAQQAQAEEKTQNMETKSAR